MDPTTDDKNALVLIVDDDNVLRQLLSKALSQAGFFVAESGDGRQGIEDYQKLQPDIVLLDIIMPELDGFSVCEEIRRLPGGETIPIVMITGQDDFKSINRAFDAGATDFVSKPINPLLLRHRLRYILRASHTIDQLNVSQIRLATAQKIAHLGTWEWYPGTKTIYWDPDVCSVFGISQEKFGNTFDDFLGLVHPEDLDGVEKSIRNAVAGKIDFQIQHRAFGTNDEEHVLLHDARVLCDNDGEIRKILFTTQDVTQKLKTEEKIKFLAYYDRLTELPNRILFKEHLSKAIADAERREAELAIMFVDIDNFRAINDSFGREIGDELIKIVGQRIKSCLRKNDTAARVGDYDITARFGADEFGVILEGLKDLSDAAIVARRLLERLNRVVNLNEHEIYLNARIGLSVFPHDGESVDQLMKNADAALSRAKELEKNTYQFFTADLNTRAFARFALEASLRKAVQRNEFKLYYQPQVELVSGKVVGVEALIRWEHPDMGIISPMEFIPLAEETGLIIQIGEWVMKTAFTQAHIWNESGYENIRMSVNLSAGQFRDPDLIDTVRQVLEETGINPALVEFEITESMLMDNVEAGIERLQQINDLGCRLSIDDFGTGYSSLNYLKRFPVHALKVDRSFVSDITINEDDALIVKAVVTLAQNLRLEVVAEGVEIAEHLTYLNYLGCNFVQGYLVSKPVPSNEVVKYFGQWNIACLNEST